jgi:hypothetical protein
MLILYLQSTQAVDKRIKISEKTTLEGRKHDGGGGKGERIDGDVAELDKFMRSVTDAAVVQESHRFMRGSQPDFASRISSFF